MTIHGKGPLRDKRSEATAARNWLVRFRCKMPEDLKKAWPDAKVLYPQPYSLKNGMPRVAIPVRDILDFLKVKKSARIIDIGAGFNQVIAGLRDSGYLNGMGIDVLGINGAVRGNFRDLSLKEKFDVIHFSNILDQYSTRDQRFMGHDGQPVELLIAKIWSHLRFSGYLLYWEPLFSDKLHAFLPGLGFVRVELPEPLRNFDHSAYAVWQKRPLP